MRKRVFKYIKYILVILGAVLLLDVFMVVGVAINAPKLKNADVIIIMGAAINTPALYNRTTEALWLYEAGLAPVMVLSGGRISDKDISEAGYMLRVLDKHSTKPLNVILDEASRNTYENMKNSKSKLPKAESVIIVSDSFHLARSVFMARAAGFKKVYYSSPDSGYYRKGELVFYYLREVAAMLNYLPKFVFN